MSFIQEQRKEQIMNTCIEELAESGYKYLTFKNIAERAGINPSLVSYHFKSKHTLIFELLEYIFGHKIEFIASRIPEDGAPLEKIKGFIQASFNHQKMFRQSNIALIEIIFNARTEENNALYMTVDDEPDPLYEILSAILEEGIEKGDFTSEINVRVLTRIIIGAIDEPILSVENEGNYDAYCKVLMDMIEKYTSKGESIK